MSTTFSFQVNVSDICPSTTLSFSPIVSNMVAYVNLGAET